MKHNPSTEERVWAVLAHLAALTMGMGVLLPIVGWSERRGKSKYAAFQCLQALGYQSLGYTIWVLFALVVAVISLLRMLADLSAAPDLEAGVMDWIATHSFITIGLLALYYALPVTAAVACALGRDFRYPFMGGRLARYVGYEADDLIEEHEDRWVAAMGHFSVIILLWGMIVPLTAWVMQAKRSPFLRFQTLQTLVYQAGVTLLAIFGLFAYLTGGIVLVATLGIFAEGIDSSGGMLGFIVFLFCALVAIVALLAVPFFHIVGQWAGYKTLKGENYRYWWVGRLVEKRLMKDTKPVVEEKQG
jgi:uncharacterized Tic20 family protein